jgi:hypothetical protein
MWSVERVKVVEFQAHLAHPLLREIASNAGEILEMLVPREDLVALKRKGHRRMKTVERTAGQS